MMTPLVSFTLACLATPTEASASQSAFEDVFWVSTTGSDSNNGSMLSPFATIAHAQDVVRMHIQNGMVRDVRVRIHPGSYFLGTTLTFDSRDSGRDGHRVIYSNVSGQDRPKLIGSDAAQHTWAFAHVVQDPQGNSHQVFQTNIGAGREIYTLYGRTATETSRYTRARFPNSGYLLAQAGSTCNMIVTDGADAVPSFDPTSAWVLNWARDPATPGLCTDPKGSYPPGLFRVDQLHMIVPLEFEFWTPLNKVRPVESEDLYFLEGAPEFLDVPGEWSLDVDTGNLLVIPWDSLTSEEVIAPTVGKVVEIGGTSPVDAPHHLLLESLEILVSDWEEAAYGAQGYGQDLGALYIHQAYDVEISDCRIHNAGADAIRIQEVAERITIHGCLIENAGVMGIYMSGENDPSGTAKILDCEVSGNILRHLGQTYPFGGGIVMDRVAGSIVNNNDIHDAPRYGVYLHFDETTGNTIAFNDVWDVMKTTGDAGGIGGLKIGAGNVIHNNFIHDISTDGQSLAKDIGPRGIYIDGGCLETEVTSNLVYGIELVDPRNPAQPPSTSNLVVKGTSNVVSNNISVAGGANGVMAHLRTKASKENESGRCLTITQNIFVDDGSTSLLYEHVTPFYLKCPSNCLDPTCPEWWPCIKSGADVGPTRLSEVDWNLAWNGSTAASSYLISVHNECNAPLLTLVDWMAIPFSYDLHSIVADPLLDSSYMLLPNSPAITQLGFQPLEYQGVGAIDNLFL